MEIILAILCSQSYFNPKFPEITGSFDHRWLYQVNLTIVGNKLTILVEMGTDYIMIYHTTMTLKNDRLILFGEQQVVLLLF